MRLAWICCSLVLAGGCADPVQRVATGFGFTEGPVWNARTGELLFSDVRRERIHVMSTDGSVTTWLEPSGGANGLAFDADGRLIACCGTARELVRFEPGGARTVLASVWNDLPLNSPNDLAIDSTGGVYFTDPRYGDADDVEQDMMAVYYVSAGGELKRVTDDSERPNGIALTPDGAGLYVAEPDRREILLYPVLSPGQLGPPRVIFTGHPELDDRGPDGFAVDGDGRLYSTWKGIVVHEADGVLVRRIPIPEHTANCALGGSGGRTLFVTARTSVYRVDLDEVLPRDG